MSLDIAPVKVTRYIGKQAFLFFPLPFDVKPADKPAPPYEIISSWRSHQCELRKLRGSN
jgi:hypothetical protein